MINEDINSLMLDVVKKILVSINAKPVLNEVDVDTLLKLSNIINAVKQ